jgi:hypothetical protein
VYTKSKFKKKSPPPKIYRIFPFYQLTCKPLLCSPNQKIIIETQFNPVASHHLNLLEKNIYAKKISSKEALQKIPSNHQKNPFLEVYLSTTFQAKIKNPILNLRLLKFNIFSIWTPIF